MKKFYPKLSLIFLVLSCGNFNQHNSTLNSHVGVKVKWEKTDLNVCWHNNTAPYERYKKQLELTTKKEIESLTNIKLIGWNTCKEDSSKQIVIQDYIGTGNDEAISFIGKAGEGGKETLKVYFRLFTSGTNQQPIEYVVLHEFYHALGGFHEHERTGSTCRPETPRVSEGLEQFGNVYIGKEDTASIVHYCRSINLVPKLSAFDALGMSLLYGFKTSPEYKALMNQALPVTSKFHKPPTDFPIPPDGTKSDAYLWMQMRLAMEPELEFFKHDMKFTQEEGRALKGYQKKYGLQQTGRLTEETWLHMTTKPIR